ncbi:MAG: hypothetical protein WDN44_15960 [Sphingomonas sp.]
MTAGGEIARQKRAIFFVFDGGTGVGHLRRLSCIARALQGQFACLIVTGHRAAANWFVPPECEYVHVPAWDSLLAEKAAYWGREPFLSDGPDAALTLRRNLMQGIVDAFEPDVLFVDHLPLGMRGELEHIIDHAKCRKYLVTRAFQNETENLAELLLEGKALGSIKDRYDRVFVAMDPRVFDVRDRYPALDSVGEKFRSVGYVIDPAAPDEIARQRNARGLGRGRSLGCRIGGRRPARGNVDRRELRSGDGLSRYRLRRRDRAAFESLARTPGGAFGRGGQPSPASSSVQHGGAACRR